MSDRRGLIDDIFGPPATSKGSRSVIDDLFGPASQEPQTDFLGNPTKAPAPLRAPNPIVERVNAAPRDPGRNTTVMDRHKYELQKNLYELDSKGVAADADRREADATAEDAGDSWSDTGRKFLDRIMPNFKEALGGAVMGATESVPGQIKGLANTGGVAGFAGKALNIAGVDDFIKSFNDNIAKQGKLPGQQMAAAAARDLEANGYNPGDSTVKKYLPMIGEGIIQMIPSIAVAAATKNPMLGAAAMTPQVYGQQYYESRTGGRSSDMSQLDAMFMAAAETLGEQIPLGMMMKPGGKFLSSTLKTAGAEAVQEMFTQVLQTGYDKGLLHPEMTWGEAFQSVVDAGVVGFGVGGALHVATAPARHKPAGEIETVEAAPPPITPEDISSALPTDLIAEGRKVVASVDAKSTADQILSANNAPAVGSRVVVSVGGRDVVGRVADAFVDKSDAELGEQAGIKIELENGKTMREFFGDLRDAGASITSVDDVIAETIAPPEPIVTPRNEERAVTPAPVARAPATGLPNNDQLKAKFRAQESGDNDNAKNPRSSATGRYQFTKGTWERLGGDWANRTDPAEQERLMNKLLDENRAALERNGITPDAGNMYAAHHFGAGGAVKMARNPNEPVAADVQAANPHLKGMTNGQALDWARRAAGGSGSTAAPAPEYTPPEMVDTPNLADEALSTKQVEAPTLETPAAPAAPEPTFTDTSSGKGIVIGNLTDEQRQAIARDVPKAKSTPNKDGNLLFAKKYEAELRTAISKASPSSSPVSTPAGVVGDGTRAAPVRVDTAEHMDVAAAQVAEPTEAQKEAGNYRKGHVNVQGLDITIETPKGATRSGTDPDGKPWSVEMPDHYGYVKRTNGADGDQVDVYVGPNPSSDRAFVVDQVDADTGAFDEHKIMLGYDNATDAMKAYRAAFSDGRGNERIGNAAAMPVEALKEHLASGDWSKPIGGETRVRATQPQIDVLGVGGDRGGAASVERVAAAARGKPITVYHGGPGIEGDIRAPFFVTDDKAFAQSYADDRGRGRGRVDSFTFTPRKTATMQDIDAAARRTPLTGKQVDQMTGGMLLDPEFNEHAAAVAADLRKQGFDSATFNDFAADSEREQPTFAVLDPSVIKSKAATQREAQLKKQGARVTNPVTPEPHPGLVIKSLQTGKERTISGQDLDRNMDRVRILAELRKRDVPAEQIARADREWTQDGDDTLARDLLRISEPEEQDTEGRPAQAGTTSDASREGRAAPGERVGAAAEGSPKAAAPKVSANTIATEDAYKAARARMKERMNRINSGVDPEMMMDGAIMAAYHLERGARTFAAYAKAMTDDLGPKIVPFLRSFYESVRYDPRATAWASEMSGPEEIGATLARLEEQAASGKIEAKEEGNASATETTGARSDDRAGDEGPSTADAPRVESAGRADGDAAAPGGSSRGDIRSDVERSGAESSERDAQSERDGAGERGNAGENAGSSRGDRAGNRVRRGSGTSRPGVNFSAPQGSLTRQGGWRATAERNLDIIELVNKLDVEGRPATPEEQTLLAKFTGWGADEIRNNMLKNIDRDRDTGERSINPYAYGEWKPTVERAAKLLRGEQLETALQSTQYAHYTSEPVIRSIWSAMERFGFSGGKLMEPGMGIGLFAAAAPPGVMENSTYTGIELDGFSAKIAGYLLPQENALHADFVKQNLPDGFFDAAIGNPPFAQVKVLDDPRYKKHRLSLHDYFFAKSIDKVRPGGLMVFVTSRYTMDKLKDQGRQYLADRADLLGAIRLPQTAFKDNAGTEVVTDVLFFQRRMPDAAPGGESWLGVEGVKAGDETVMVNEYFARHPEMVLGQHATTGSMYRKNEYTVTPAEGDIAEHFAKAVEQLPKDVYSEAVSAGIETAKAKTWEADMRPAAEKEGGLYLKDGKVFIRENGVGTPVSALEKVTPAQEKWLASYAGVRDALKQAQRDQLGEGNWEASLKALNKAYDAFVKEHGPIQANTVTERRSEDEDRNETVVTYVRLKNQKLLDLDVESPLVLGLEKVADDGTISKGQFLTGRTLNKPTRPKIESAQDALAVSLDEIGRLDINYVASLAKMDREAVIEAMGDGIYQAPSGVWQTSDEYLSGDVLAKLEEAQAAAAIDSKYERNVQALLAVQPKPLGPQDIAVKLGAGWVPADIVKKFAADVAGFDASTMSYEPATAEWAMEGKGARRARSASEEFGTAARSPQEIMLAVLNNQTIKVQFKDSDGKTYTDQEATAAANEVAKKLTDRFREWVWEDARRASTLLEIYNRRFNNLAPRRFDGGHLTLPGLSAKYSLYDHQKRAIWRIIQTGNVYLAHAVGAGKTLEMIVSGMEQKRLGLIKKPMYVVPNHMLNQFAREFMEAYPAASIMVADDKSFHTDNRKRFMAQAALNDPDAIVITHSSFAKLGTKEESRATIVQGMITELEAALEGSDTRHTRSKIEKQIESLQRNFEAKTGSGKDQALTFEEMGVDYVYVDEAHLFRKLDYATNRAVKGIDPKGSMRALDLYIKTRWLESQRPGRSLTLASGTPVTNTMAEIYTVMRYMNESELERDGLRAFDAWANMFGEVAAGYEQNAAGGYEIVERFAKFVNVPELMKRVRSFMDVLTGTDLGDLVKRPDLNGGQPQSVVTPPIDSLREYMDGELKRRIETTRKWKPSKEQPANPDPIIAINTDARLSSIDMRFIDPTLPNDPGSKLNVMIDQIIQSHRDIKGIEYVDPKTGKKEAIKGGTQIVFSAVGFGEGAQKNRGFDLRGWVDGRLMKEAGLKKGEIAWMSDANTHAKKEALFKDMRAGKIRALFGSPANMGTGVNVQNRLKTLHFLAPPWYPADVEQPHGRIIRQGNWNSDVDIYWYATKGTYDSTAWGMVSRKARFIEQAMSGDDSVRSLDDISEANQYEMAAAMAAGDERIMQVVGLTSEIERLGRLQGAHADEQRQLASEERYSKQDLENARKRLADLEAAEKARVANAPFRLTVDGATYDKQGEAGTALINLLSREMESRQATPTMQLGTYQGDHTISVRPSERRTRPGAEIVLKVGPLDIVVLSEIEKPDQIDPAGLATRIKNAVDRLPSDVRSATHAVAETEREIKKIERKLGAPFPQEQQLAEKIAERANLQATLAAETAAANAPPAEPKQSAIGDWSQIAGRVDIEEFRKELKAELRKMDPMGRISLRVTDGMIPDFPTASGLYWPGARIMDIAVNHKRSGKTALFTLNHEIIHAFRDMGLFTQAEWGALTQSALSDEATMASVRKRYPSLSEAAQIEEAIADRFGDWQQLQSEISDSMASRALLKIATFLRGVVRVLSGQKWKPLSEAVYDKMNSGELGSRAAKGTFGRRVPQESSSTPDSTDPKQSIVGSIEPHEETVTEIMARTRDLRGKLAEGYENWRISMQDRMLSVLRAEESVARVLGRELTVEERPYLAEELMTGRVGAKMDRLADDLIEPLFAEMKAENVSAEEIESYLYARHAPERNAHIAEINPEFDEGTGSGMTDIEAAAIMRRIDLAGRTEAFERVAKRVDAILEFAREERIEAGLMSEEQAESWRNAYEHYVPLRGFAELDGADTRPSTGGQGLTVRGAESKRAFGRRSKAEDILAHTIMQAEEAIVRGEKNRVARAFYELAKAAPDPDFWAINKVTMKRDTNPDTGLVETYPVRKMLAEDAEWTVSLKIDGKERRVTMNKANPPARKLAEAMRRLNEQQTNAIVGVLSKLNRWLSAVNTSLSPDFVVTNAVRDIQTALVNAAGLDVKGLQTGIARDYRKAMFAATKGAFGKENGEWGRWWREFTDAGGRVSYNQTQDLETLRKDIVRRFDPARRPNPTGMNTAPKQMAMIAMGDLKALYGFIDKVNTGVENAVRLAAFKNAVELGASPEQAASIAKNLTVNFNRRGSHGVYMNALYLFYNASVQGSTRLLVALKHRNVQKIVAGIVAAGALQELINMVIGGDDDDGEPIYDKIPEFEKSRNIILMVPGPWGDYLKLPMPWGYNAFHTLGRKVVEGVRGEPIGGVLGDTATAFIDAFNPIGGTNSLLNFLAPTLFDPIVDLQRNRDFADKPIMPEQSQFGPATPDNQRYWGNVSPAWKAVTDALNVGTGGDEVVPGAIDVSPETLEYIFSVATGGAGAMFERTGAAVLKVADGDPETELSVNDIPVVRRVVGKKPSWYDKAAFYERLGQVEQVVDNARTYGARGDREGLARYLQSNSDVVEMRDIAKQARKAMRSVRAARNAAKLGKEVGRLSDDQYRQNMTAMSEAEKGVIRTFNQRYMDVVKQPLKP